MIIKYHTLLTVFFGSSENIQLSTNGLFSAIDSGTKKQRHTYQSLENIAETLKSEFEELIKKCSDKITEMCKVEKETWLKLDQLEADCQKLITQVEKKAETLVSL